MSSEILALNDSNLTPCSCTMSGTPRISLQINMGNLWGVIHVLVWGSYGRVASVITRLPVVDMDPNFVGTRSLRRLTDDLSVGPARMRAQLAANSDVAFPSSEQVQCLQPLLAQRTFQIFQLARKPSVLPEVSIGVSK